MERYESWIDRARSSYQYSKAIVNKYVYYEDLCYQAQQAVEKALKGLLIYFGEEPDFTHNIGVLLSKIEKNVEINEKIKEGMDLTNYAVQTRYPGQYTEITKKEYKRAVKIAKECINWVEEVIKKKENEKNETK